MEEDKADKGRGGKTTSGKGVRQVPEGSEEQGKMEKSGCKIICGAPTTLAVKRLMVVINLTPDTGYFSAAAQSLLKRIFRLKPRVVFFFYQIVIDVC